MPDPTRLGHVSTNGGDNNGYSFMYRFDTGEIISYSKPEVEWGRLRDHVLIAPGDNMPRNVSELLPNISGIDFGQGLVNMTNMTLDRHGGDYGSNTSELIEGIRDMNSLAMCPQCNAISTSVGGCECPHCNSFIGRSNANDYESLNGMAVNSNHSISEDTIRSIGKLIELSLDGYVRIRVRNGRIIFSLPAIHFDRPEAHRFTRIVNCNVLLDHCPDLYADTPHWVDVRLIVQSNSFDGYIGFIKKYGRELMASEDEVVLIGSTKDVAERRAEYISARVFQYTTKFAFFFFDNPTETSQELSAPLYQSMARRFHVQPTVQHDGSVAWGLEQIESVSTRADVRLELLGVIESMEDVDFDSIINTIRSTYGT